MKVLGVTYERTFNLGDYNSEKIGLSAELEKGDDVLESIADLRSQVIKSQDSEGVTLDAEEEEETDKKSKKKAKKASKKKGKKNAKSTSDSDDENEHEDNDDEGDEESSDESDSDDEAADDEDDDNGDSDSDDDESEEDSDDEPKAKGKKAKGSKKGKSDKKPKGKKGKSQVYDRENEKHKEIFSKVLRSVDKNWKDTDKGLARGKKASMEMEGHDFLDAEGEVLESFTEGVEGWMKAKKKK